MAADAAIDFRAGHDCWLFFAAAMPLTPFSFSLVTLSMLPRQLILSMPVDYADDFSMPLMMLPGHKFRCFAAAFDMAMPGPNGLFRDISDFAFALSFDAD